MVHFSRVKLLIFFFLLMGTGPAFSFQEIKFKLVEEGHFTTHHASTGGISLVDIDNDLDLDVFVSNGYDVSSESPQPQKNRLYINDGNGGLTLDESSVLSNDTLFSSGSVWGDYDNDGYIDVFIANQRGQHNSLYRGLGNGEFESVSNTIVAQDSGYSYSANWVDIDRDGDLDLYVANGGLSHSEEDFLYENQGSGNFTKNSLPEFTQLERSSIGGLWRDFNSDNLPDLYVSYRQNKDRIYFNKGDWEFEAYELDAPVIERYTFPKSAGTAADIDNDGDIDIYQTSSLGGANFLFINDGKGKFRFEEKGALTSAGGHAYGAAFSDLDNDGAQEAIIANWGSSVQLFSSKGNGFEWVNSEGLSERVFYASTITTGDLDGDGKEDLFIPQWPNSPGEFEKNAIYLNKTEPSGNWIRIKLEGSVSNKSAIGAGIRITCWQNDEVLNLYRVVSSQQTWRSQSGLARSFGLGTCPVVEKITVEWPSDKVTVLKEIKVNQALLIKETGGQ